MKHNRSIGQASPYLKLPPSGAGRILEKYKGFQNPGLNYMWSFQDLSKNLNYPTGTLETHMPSGPPLS